MWVKYHFKTEQGVKKCQQDVAAKLAGENPDYHTEDLFNAIDKGDFPTWKVICPNHAIRGCKHVSLGSI